MPPQVSIALLAALPLEVRPFLRRSRARRRRGLPWPAWEFAADGVRGLLALSGMGARAAREAAAQLIGQFRPQLLVSFGFAGGVTAELQPGDLVVGEAFYQYDPAVGEPPEPVIGPAPRPALAALLRALTTAGLSARAGSLVTSPYILNKAGQAGALKALAAPALDLESAAVAEVARDLGLPLLGLRAITDTAAEELPGFLASAGEQSGTVGLLEVLGWLAADPRRLKDLVHLWRRSRLAACRLAQGLMALAALLETPETWASGQEFEEQ